VIDAVITTVILSATAYAVWLLAASSTGSLSSAHSEIQRRREAERELKILNARDSLTGVYNRRFFDAEMARFGPARLYPISVIVADIDGLKAVNDELGHGAGDLLLVQAGNVLSSIVRVEDVLARIGGDEFAILLPKTDEESAEDAVRRIEQRLAEQPVGDGAPCVSLSIGVATSLGGGLDKALARADSRMYRRKSEKRAGNAQAAVSASTD
jgi:diguanylate cyclase (GGDEF)-like protein